MMNALAPYHLSPVTGAHSDTGVIGLTLGGGQGLLSKEYGPTVDQIVSAEVVSADGSIHMVNNDMSKKKNPQLAEGILFTVRGGAGNIGVVTDLTMKEYPVRNLAMMAKINFVLTQSGARDVLVRYGEWSLGCPDDCTSICILSFRSPVIVTVFVSSNTTVIPQNQPADEAAARIKSSDDPGFTYPNKNYYLFDEKSK